MTYAPNEDELRVAYEEQERLRARVAELEADVASKDLDATEQAGRAEKAEAQVATLREALNRAKAQRYALTGGPNSIAGAFNAGADMVLKLLDTAIAATEPKEKP